MSVSIPLDHSEVDLTKWSEIVDKRAEQRVEFRTTGALYLLKADGELASPVPIRVWTTDVSATGALIKSFEKFDHSKVLIELLMPELDGSLIEGRVVHQKQSITEHLNGLQEVSQLYGVHFEKFVPRSILSRDAAKKLHQVMSTSGVQHLSKKRQEKSLTPKKTMFKRLVRTVEFLFILIMLVAYLAVVLFFE